MSNINTDVTEDVDSNVRDEEFRKRKDIESYFLRNASAGDVIYTEKTSPQMRALARYYKRKVTVQEMVVVNVGVDVAAKRIVKMEIL